jgi:hypothetical protein
MIPIQHLTGNQFEKARRLNAPVVVCDARTFRVPSSRRGERDHRLQLDDAERPHAVSCTCEAGERGRVCWAMARVLDALDELRACNIYVSPGAPSSWSASEAWAGALEPEPRAGIVDGDLALMWGGHPEAGVLYNIPR